MSILTNELMRLTYESRFKQKYTAKLCTLRHIKAELNMLSMRIRNILNSERIENTGEGKEAGSAPFPSIKLKSYYRISPLV